MDESTVKVDFGGVTREVLSGFDRVSAGELVMVHSGVVIGKTNESEIVTNLGLFMEAEKLGLEELGYKPEDAKRQAEDEFRNLLGSMGLDAGKYMADGKLKFPALDVEQHRDGTSIPDFAFRERFKTALSDMDYLQVMHYTNYFRLVERAWMSFLSREGFSYVSMIHKYGVFIPTVETAGKILAPVRMDSEVEVAVWVEELGKKHVKYRGVITNLTSGKVSADIHHTAVATDTTLMESVELPKGFAERLSAFVSKE